MGPVLALDVGTQVIGIAVSDAGRRFVFPVRTLARKSVAKDADALATICREKAVTELLVGLALDEAGVEGRIAKLARQVGDALAAKTGLPVHYIDERFTTAEARQRLDEGGVPRGLQRTVIDQQAAMVMLEEGLARADVASAHSGGGPTSTT